MIQVREGAQVVIQAGAMLEVDRSGQILDIYSKGDKKDSCSVVGYERKGNGRIELLLRLEGGGAEVEKSLTLDLRFLLEELGERWTRVTLVSREGGAGGKKCGLVGIHMSLERVNGTEPGAANMHITSVPSAQP